MGSHGRTGNGSVSPSTRHAEPTGRLFKVAFRHKQEAFGNTSGCIEKALAVRVLADTLEEHADRLRHPGTIGGAVSVCRGEAAWLPPCLLGYLLLRLIFVLGGTCCSVEFHRVWRRVLFSGGGWVTDVPRYERLEGAFGPPSSHS